MLLRSYRLIPRSILKIASPSCIDEYLKNLRNIRSMLVISIPRYGS